jgi:ABC-type multidrug transport system permease subunit
MATNEILGLMNYVFGRILSTFPLPRRYSDGIDKIAHAFSQGFKTGWPWDGILAALICVLVSYVCHVVFPGFALRPP